MRLFLELPVLGLKKLHPPQRHGYRAVNCNCHSQPEIAYFFMCYTFFIQKIIHSETVETQSVGEHY